MAIFIISRVKNLSRVGPCTNFRFREELNEIELEVAWPVAMSIKDNDVMSFRPQDRNELPGTNRFCRDTSGQF